MTSSHRVATLRNLVVALFEHEQITTTLPKAKVLRPIAERMISLGKRGDPHARRLVHSQLKDQVITSKLFDQLAERFRGRRGGYTRVLKAGLRFGDATEMAVIELVDRDESAKGLRTRSPPESEAQVGQAS
jgi:large subunit ribosomal protein L17